MIDTKKVKTVILLMFENRSFDHMLGHLSFENINPKVNGFTKPIEDFKSIYNTAPFYPYPLQGNIPLSSDIPHEFGLVDKQLSWHKIKKKFMMDGFVEAYAEFSHTVVVREAAKLPAVIRAKLVRPEACGTCSRWIRCRCELRLDAASVDDSRADVGYAGEPGFS